MKIIPIVDAQGLQEAAETMLKKVMRNPKARKLFTEILADPSVDRETLLAIGFVYGASFAIQEHAAGNVREMGDG